MYIIHTHIYAFVNTVVVFPCSDELKKQRSALYVFASLKGGITSYGLQVKRIIVIQADPFVKLMRAIPAVISSHLLPSYTLRVGELNNIYRENSSSDVMEWVIIFSHVLTFIVIRKFEGQT